MRHEEKTATILRMTDDELRPTPESSDASTDASTPSDPIDAPTASTVGSDWDSQADESSDANDDKWLPDPTPDLAPAPAAAGDDWIPGDSADVDEALAAVASLSQLITDREADDLLRRESGSSTKAVVGKGIPSPSPILLKRGQPASLIPALLLIAAGAYWTFINTTGSSTSGGQIDTLVILDGGIALLVVVLLLAWINFGRWTRGAIFLAALIALLAGSIALMLRMPGLDLPTAYPLLLAAPGLAFILTAFLGRPASARLLIPGVLLIAAAAVGIFFNAGLLAFDLAPILPIAAPILGVVIVALWLLGLIARRRA